MPELFIGQQQSYQMAEFMGGFYDVRALDATIRVSGADRLHGDTRPMESYEDVTAAENLVDGIIERKVRDGDMSAVEATIGRALALEVARLALTSRRQTAYAGGAYFGPSTPNASMTSIEPNEGGA